MVSQIENSAIADNSFDCTYPVKAQDVRLLDVFVFGPMMIWAAYTPRMTGTERLALAIIGAGTILYNGLNYLEIQKQRRNYGIGN